MFESAIIKHPQPETRQRPPKRSAARQHRLSRTRRLRIEPLEDRRLLSVVSNEQGWAFGIGPGTTWINDVSVDSAGNSLVCGDFSGNVDFDPSDTISILPSAAGGFLASYNRDGSLNWVRLVSSTGYAKGVAMDAEGNTFVTGFLSQGEVGGVSLTGDTWSGYLVKYDPAGATDWVRQWTVTPSIGAMYPTAVTLSPSGEHLYVSGDINGTGYFGEGFTIPDPGPSHAFVVKVNSDSGLLDWAWGPQGYGYTVAQRLAVDTQDNVYVAGEFMGTMDPEGDIVLTSRGGDNGQNDVFVAKLSTTSDGGVATAWAQTMGGTDYDALGDLALTSDKSALYVTGGYGGQADFGTEILTAQGGGDTFVAKMSLAGDFLWAKSVGGPGGDYGGKIAVASGDAGVYIAGGFRPSNGIDLDPGDGAVLPTSAGLADAYVLHLNSEGSYQRALHLGNVAASSTTAKQIAIQNGTIYVAGSYIGDIELPPGRLAGGAERIGFLSALRPSANVPVAPTAQDDPYESWQYYTLAVPTCEGVLANDSNPNLDSLRATLVENVKNGTLNLRADGSFEYTPIPGYTGLDSFTYTVDNGQPGMTDIGTVNINVKPLAAETFASTDVPKNIIDAAYRTNTSQIVVDSVFLIDDLNVTINITHPRTPDLDVFLVSPKGTRVELFTDVGTNKSANFTGTILDDDVTKSITKGTAPFTGSFQPGGKLFTFDGEPAAGTWTLEIVDDQLKQAGTLNSWSLTVTPAIPAAPLHAEEVGHNDAVAVLSHAEAQSLLAEAFTRWQALGIDTSSLSGLSLQIGDLGGPTLGLAAHNTIWLDDDAAGWGWFIDHTPGSDSEFTRSGNQGEQDRIDLLSVVTHELGHLLGYDHDEAGLMAAMLAAGERRTTLAHDHAGAVDELFGQATDLVARGFWSTDPLPATHPWAKRRR